MNTALIGFLYQALNQDKRLVLLTRHAHDIDASLKTYRLGGLFDDVRHLDDNEAKSHYIDQTEAIFIDDSHAERADIASRCGIPVFAPDMVETLLD